MSSIDNRNSESVTKEINDSSSFTNRSPTCDSFTYVKNRKISKYTDDKYNNLRNTSYDKRNKKKYNKRTNNNREPKRKLNDKLNKDENKEYADVGNNNKNFDDLPDTVDDFEDMNFLTEDLFLGINEYGFKYPSPIQARTIHIINSGCDLIAQSQSGTGKTGAFTIGSLSVIDKNKHYPQAIIMANTRPLACQIAKVVENISKHMNIKVCLCVGGYKSTSHANSQEAKNSHVLVGTPGRIRDILFKDTFDGNKIKILVMDESDVLLQDDFQVQVEDIIKNIGEKTQICVFSATFTKQTLETTERFLINPYRVTVEREKLSLDRVKQYKVQVGYDRNKIGTLFDLFSKLCISQMIVFVNSIRVAEIVRNKMMDNDIEAGLVHGKMGSIDRENVLKEFRLANIKTLITTDVMCRGIDIDDLKMVINFDMADEPETYIHRVGRSGRYGGQGIAINFCTYNDMHKVKVLDREYNITIEDMPDPEDVNEYLIGMKPPQNKVLSSKNYKY